MLVLACPVQCSGYTVIRSLVTHYAEDADHPTTECRVSRRLEVAERAEGISRGSVSTLRRCAGIAMYMPPEAAGTLMPLGELTTGGHPPRVETVER